MSEDFNFLEELYKERHFKSIEDSRKNIEEALGMTLEEAKQLHKDQLDMHKKYPDATEYDCWSENDYDVLHYREEHCPFCNEEMCLCIDEGGPWDEFGMGTLGGDAIGQGRHSGGYDYEGFYTGYYQIYYKCPHCGKIFYKEYET